MRVPLLIAAVVAVDAVDARSRTRPERAGVGATFVTGPARFLRDGALDPEARR